MIIRGSKLQIIDNSGGFVGACLRIVGKKSLSTGKLGDYIVLSIKVQDKRSKYLKKKIYLGLLVGTRKNQYRLNGVFLKFNSNRTILLNDVDTMLANRVFGPLCLEVRKKRLQNILNITRYII